MFGSPCRVLAFVEGLIGTIRREYFDQAFFWNAADLAHKLNDYKITTRIESIGRSAARRPRYAPAHPQLFRSCLTTARGGHICRGLFQTPIAPDLYFATHSGASAIALVAPVMRTIEPFDGLGHAADPCWREVTFALVSSSQPSSTSGSGIAKSSCRV